jgi:hypothetical protein
MGKFVQGRELVRRVTILNPRFLAVDQLVDLAKFPLQMFYVFSNSSASRFVRWPKLIA